MCFVKWFSQFSHLWFVFLFKQKTAYEMRISDWSSDVCSSDLRFRSQAGGVPQHLRVIAVALAQGVVGVAGMQDQHRQGQGGGSVHGHHDSRHGTISHRGRAEIRTIDAVLGRSEEHTSELQSLMRTSYAVFCLKKKQNHTHI